MASEACGCIYVIDCFDTEDLYIGSTVNFNDRKGKHKFSCSNDKCRAYNYKLYQTIREYGGWDNWAMFTIEEEIPIEQLKEREQFYINTLEPSLNEKRALLTKEDKKKRDKERNKKNYEQNKQQIRQERRKYMAEKRKENPEIFIERGKQFRLKHQDKLNENQKHQIECECGELIAYRNKARHTKSQKHIKLMENKISVKVI